MKKENNLYSLYLMWVGFPESSAGKESTCNTGEPSSISGLGRFPGEGMGYPLQYSWASLVVQMVKNLPARWEDPNPRMGKQWKQWQTLFSWTPKLLQVVTVAIKLKDTCSLEEKP